jgi:hypothetical protein
MCKYGLHATHTGDDVALCIVDVGLHDSNRSARSTRKISVHRLRAWGPN